MAWGIVMMVAMVVVVALIVAGTIWLVRRLVHARAGSKPNSDRQPNARQVLDRRYAAGEIDDEEYRERRSVLEQGA